MRVIIPAAGRGTRLNAGSRLPKVMHSVLGRPLLAHVLDIVDFVDPKDNARTCYTHREGDRSKRRTVHLQCKGQRAYHGRWQGRRSEGCFWQGCDCCKRQSLHRLHWRLYWQHQDAEEVSEHLCAGIGQYFQRWYRHRAGSQGWQRGRPHLCCAGQ